MILSLKTEFVDNYSLADAWNCLKKTDCASLINALELTKNNLNLNDYGYYLLVKDFADKLYPNSGKRSRILQWFLLSRIGYDLKIGYVDHDVQLLFQTAQPVYSRKMLTSANEKQYCLLENSSLTQLIVYPFDYNPRAAAMDLNMYYPVNFAGSPVSKIYHFTYDGKEYPVELKYNREMVAYYEQYPQTDLKVYFNTAVSGITSQSVHEAFLPYIKDMTPWEAANFLIAFVQKAFPYEIDVNQFGKEKFCFPEELIHYGKGDCDDKAVFYAYLVKTLIGLDVMGLEFHNHVAVGINFPGPLNGKGVKLYRKTFTVADPTMDDAPVGYYPDDMDVNLPKPIPVFSKNMLSQSFFDKTRYCLHPLKILKSSPNQSLVTDWFERIIISGYETDSLTKLISENPGSTAVVACLDAGCRELWHHRFLSSGLSRCLAIDTDMDDNINVIGNFTGVITEGNVTLSTKPEKTDVFVAQLNAEGKLNWISQLHLDTLPRGLPLNFAGELGRNGEIIESWLYDPLELAGNSMLASGENNKVFLNIPLASFNIGIPEVATRGGGTQFEADLIKKETDLLLKNAVTPSVAGLFAVVNILSAQGKSIRGSSIKLALDRYNPTFKERCPNIYAALSRITMLVNDNGILKIIIDNNDKIVIEQIKVYNEARATLMKTRTGDIRISFLNGAKVGKAIVWYDLNQVDIWSKNGDMLFDYDADHTKKKVNLAKDVLN